MLCFLMQPFIRLFRPIFEARLVAKIYLKGEEGCSVESEFYP